MNPLIPIIVGGVLYWIVKDSRSPEEKLAEEKRRLRKRMKEISKQQQQRASQDNEDLETSP